MYFTLYEPKKIRDAFSGPVRDLAQMAKLAKIAPKTRIQGATYLGFNFNQNVSRYPTTNDDDVCDKNQEKNPDEGFR